MSNKDKLVALLEQYREVFIRITAILMETVYLLSKRRELLR
ncbi:MAG: hypothetical protein VX737_03215 [Pseudomonadota bacterium]|nr:hypothetical protein [Pseudomonadota bacterium]